MIAVGCAGVGLVQHHAFRCLAGGLGGTEVGQCLRRFVRLLVEVAALHQRLRIVRTLCQCRIQALPCFVLLCAVARCQRGGQQGLQVRVVRCELHGLPCLTDGIGVILARVGSIGTLCGTAVALQVGRHQLANIACVARLAVLERCRVGLGADAGKRATGTDRPGALLDALLQQQLCPCVSLICWHWRLQRCQQCSRTHPIAGSQCRIHREQAHVALLRG